MVREALSNACQSQRDNRRLVFVIAANPYSNSVVDNSRADDDGDVNTVPANLDRTRLATFHDARIDVNDSFVAQYGERGHVLKSNLWRFENEPGDEPCW
jgi:hypothetical protein